MEYLLGGKGEGAMEEEGGEEEGGEEEGGGQEERRSGIIHHIKGVMLPIHSCNRAS